MKKLPASEILAISKLIQMETNGLAMAKAGINAITDDELKTLARTGIVSTEARIKGLQQFISDNEVVNMPNELEVTDNE